MWTLESVQAHTKCRPLPNSWAHVLVEISLHCQSSAAFLIFVTGSYDLEFCHVECVYNIGITCVSSLLQRFWGEVNSGSQACKVLTNPLQSTFHMYVGWEDRSIGKVPATQVQGPAFSSRSPTPREFTFISNTSTCRERYQERGRYLELFS